MYIPVVGALPPCTCCLATIVDISLCLFLLVADCCYFGCRIRWLKRSGMAAVSVSVIDGNVKSSRCASVIPARKDLDAHLMYEG